MNLKALQRKLALLSREKKAYQAQNKLLENLIDLARSSSESEMLMLSMQNTLDLAAQVSGAEKASLLLLDEQGVVTDSILTRDHLNSETRTNLIGCVLDKGLAGWVKKHWKVGLVEDSRTDGRWFDMPDQPYSVRSALAVPIVRHGSLFGILTLMHSEPCRFKKEAMEIVQTTADQMALAVENAKLYVELAKAKKDVEAISIALKRELEKGRKIQRDFLPKRLPKIGNLEIAAHFKPALQVSGDFYDVFVLPENFVGILIGDVSDKGVGAGLFMALIRSFIRIFAERLSLNLARPERLCGERCSTAGKARCSALEAVDITNGYLFREHGDEGMFATLFFGVLDPESGLLQYVSAGHEPVFVFGDGIEPRYLGPTGPAIGLLESVHYQCRESALEPGAILFGYTDGVTEACSPSEEMFGKERLKRFVSESGFASAKECVWSVQSHLFSFIDSAPAFDDITMLAVRRRK